MTRLLLERLESLRGRVVVYGPRNGCGRGGTVAFNLHRDGRVVPYKGVELAAREHRIALRGGCFCNSGGTESAFSVPADRAAVCLRGRFSVQRTECLGSGAVGALRVSIGIPTTVGNLDRLATIAEKMTTCR